MRPSEDRAPSCSIALLSFSHHGPPRSLGAGRLPNDTVPPWDSVSPVRCLHDLNVEGCDIQYFVSWRGCKW